jgi:hypothetical protein
MNRKISNFLSPSLAAKTIKLVENMSENMTESGKGTNRSSARIRKE